MPTPSKPEPKPATPCDLCSERAANKIATDDGDLHRCDEHTPPRSDWSNGWTVTPV